MIYLSWYWMPDVFEEYFAKFGKKTSDYYQLKRLDPSYQIFFGKDDIKKSLLMSELEKMLEKYELGSSKTFESF
ncbi:MAG: hypothetical protein R2784_06620 [Saprospiraceae bacterium]